MYAPSQDLPISDDSNTNSSLHLLSFYYTNHIKGIISLDAQTQLWKVGTNKNSLKACYTAFPSWCSELGGKEGTQNNKLRHSVIRATTGSATGPLRDAVPKGDYASEPVFLK